LQQETCSFRSPSSRSGIALHRDEDESSIADRKGVAKPRALQLAQDPANQSNMLKVISR
jgi:hypothetical protein